MTNIYSFGLKVVALRSLVSAPSSVVKVTCLGFLYFLLTLIRILHLPELLFIMDLNFLNPYLTILY